MELEIEEGLEAGCVIGISDTKLLILGGRTDNGDTNFVTEIDFEKGSMVDIGDIG